VTLAQRRRDIITHYPATLRVWRLMADDDQDEPVSMRHVARVAGLHISSTQRHLNRLEEAGAVARTGYGYTTSRGYILRVRPPTD
jgi:DNA-binding IclR family transcriptional regulator